MTVFEKHLTHRLHKDAEFIAEMKAIRIATNAKLAASKIQLDSMLTELRQFDRETKKSF